MTGHFAGCAAVARIIRSLNVPGSAGYAASSGFELKMFVTVVAKDAVEVTTVDVFSFPAIGAGTIWCLTWPEAARRMI